MRIIRKEIRKVLSIRLIVILLLFSALYVTQIPYLSMNWWNHSDSPYEVDLHRELIGKFGATITADEWEDYFTGERVPSGKMHVKTAGIPVYRRAKR